MSAVTNDLTPWETRILRLIASGWTNARLARRFQKSEAAFELTRSSIYRNLGAANAPHAVKLGYERGLLGPAQRS
jgi:DNA-binding NarL/FixJ family response regulator